MDDCIIYRKTAIQDDCSHFWIVLDHLMNWELEWQIRFSYAKCHMMNISQLRKPVFQQ